MDKSRKSFREFLELSENKKETMEKGLMVQRPTHGSDVEGAEDYKIQRKSQKGQNMFPPRGKACTESSN